MRTVEYTRQGVAAQVLTLREEARRPTPGIGEVLVRMLVRPIPPGDLIGVEGLPGQPEQQSGARTHLAELLADGGTPTSYGHLSPGTTSLEALPLMARELTVRGVSILHWMSHIPRERAEDVAFAQDLARNTPDLLDVAAGYDPADFKAAIEHARRPASSGTVLLTTPRTAGSGRGAAG